MASSGLIPPVIINAMGSRIGYKNKSGSDRYGKPTYPATPTRSNVKCMIQPAGRILRRPDGTEVTVSRSIYADDVDIEPEAQIILPDGDITLMESLDTYTDDQGRKVYQVINLA